MSSDTHTENVQVRTSDWLKMSAEKNETCLKCLGIKGKTSKKEIDHFHPSAQSVYQTSQQEMA